VRTFARQVLEAKIIGPGGMTISIASEWLATDLNGQETKEDCEINAFKRLAEKIKTHFPKLSICILADGLYPSEPFLHICEENNWKYCVVLKDQKLSTVWEQVETILAATEASGEVVNMLLTDNGTIEWIHEIGYRGHKMNWLVNVEGYGSEQRKFAYLTNLRVTHSTAQKLVSVGRSRWLIEDSFNTQKNRGYNLSHKYSRASFTATRNYYVLMQIADMINQLVSYSQHCARLLDHAKETLQHLWGLIVSALTFAEDIAQPATRTQYRFR
jgi:hypothetical protein